MAFCPPQKLEEQPPAPPQPAVPQPALSQPAVPQPPAPVYSTDYINSLLAASQAGVYRSGE